MNPIQITALFCFTVMFLSGPYWLFMHFVWPRLKARWKAHIDNLKTLKAYDVIEQERKAKIVKANEVQEVEVEDLKEESPVIWDFVSNGKRETRHIVLEIKKPLQIE